jgi:hypothetical protein
MVIKQGGAYMRRVIAGVTTALGIVGLGMALAIPAQAQPGATLAASDSYGKITTICPRDVAVRKSSDGRIIGHLHKGQKFKVISSSGGGTEFSFSTASPSLSRFRLISLGWR